MAKKNELETTSTASGDLKVATGGVNLPDFLQGTEGMGNEAVTSKDLTFPRIGIAQALSPELDKDNAKCINGLAQGDLFNTLTREVIPQPCRVMDTYFQKVYGVFKKRTEGGGFKAQFASEEEAGKFVAADPEGDKLEIVDTGIHVCLLLDADLNPVSEAVIFFTKTKLKVSRQMNAILKGKGAARCATVWELTVVKETNSKNQPYYNLKAADCGFILDVNTFKRAMALYESVKGKDVSVAAAEDEAIPDAERNY